MRATSRTPRELRTTLRAAREAFEIGDTKEERRALASIPVESLSDEQFARLVALQLDLNAEHDVERVVGLAKHRVFKSERTLLRLASLLASKDRVDLACTLLEAVVADTTASSRLVVYWASLVIDRLERPREVLSVLDRSLLWAPWLRAVVRGKAQAASNEIDPALASLQEAVLLAPHESIAWFELAVLQRRIGLGSSSISSLKRTIELEPDHVTAHRLLGYDHHYLSGDKLIVVLEALKDRLAEFLPVTQVELNYALAKVYEDLGDLDSAFRHYESAGQIQRRISPWDYPRQQRLNSRLMDQVTESWIKATSASGVRSERPVFVMGMPRSGTTLVEQTIAAHPDAFGAGELKTIERLLHGLKVGSFTLLTARPTDVRFGANAFNATQYDRGQAYLLELQRLTNSAARVVDKMPGNFQWMGLIAAMLPDARFIHCRRHPLDCCLSQYRLYFGTEVPYSYDLRDLGRAYRAYHEITRHWAAVIGPDRLCEIRYEDLVSDFERRARNLVEFCGLSWDRACLDYSNSTYQVKTASASQVRSAPYTSAIGRWRRYKPFLAPLIDEIGDLVDQY